MRHETVTPSSPLSIRGITAMAGCSLLPALLLAALALETGCATPDGTQHANDVGAGIAEYRHLVVKVRGALSATLKSLDGVMMDADGDLQPAFRRFDESLHRLEVDSIQARARADAMRARGDAYFEEWEAQLSAVGDEQARQAAAERRAQLRKSFEEIRRTSQQAREEFRPFISELRDLRVALGDDPSLARIDAAKTLILKSQADGRSVERALDGVLAELNSVAATIKSKNAPKQQR